MRIKLLAFALTACMLLPGVSLGDQKILNTRGQVVGSVRSCASGLCLRDAQGRPAGRIVLKNKRVTVYDYRGRRL